METLSEFAVGKPVVIEEMFPLDCPLPEFERFLDESRKTASGWIGFYWGRTPDEYRGSNTIQDARVPVVDEAGGCVPRFDRCRPLPYATSEDSQPAPGKQCDGGRNRWLVLTASPLPAERIPIVKSHSRQAKQRYTVTRLTMRTRASPLWPRRSSPYHFLSGGRCF